MDHLAVALTDAEATVRAAAAGGLGGLGLELAALPLLTALDDEAAEVRQAAQRGLATLLDDLDDQVATGVLVDALDHQSATVRAAAAEGLGGVGLETAVLPLLLRVDDPAAEAKDAAAKGLTALLARLPDGTAVAALFNAKKNDAPSVQKGADAALRTYLAGIGAERAVAAVVAVKAGDAWLAVALGVPQARIAAETRRLGIQLEPLETILAKAAAARKGKPVAGARRYAASAAFHPAVLLAVSKFPAATTDRWSPTALRFLELVVIEQITWKKLQVCPYYGPDITRYQAVSSVRVISAVTGKVVAQRTYKGSAPRACRKTEAYSLRVLRGSTPSLTPAITWLKSLIHPPA